MMENHLNLAFADGEGEQAEQDELTLQCELNKVV
jgi:hypothetical protein